MRCGLTAPELFAGSLMRIMLWRGSPAIVGFDEALPGRAILDCVSRFTS